MESSMLITGFPEVNEVGNLSVGDFFVRRGENETHNIYIVVREKFELTVACTCLSDGSSHSLYSQILVVPVAVDITVTPIIREDFCVTLGKS